jgi:hypothetical protein
MVPFAPPIADQVMNGAPRGFRPEAVVILREVPVKAFSRDVVIMKLTELAPLELLLRSNDSMTITYWLLGSYESE